MRKSRVSFPREEVAEGKSQFVFAFKLPSGERIEMRGQMSAVFLEKQMCEFIDRLQEEGRKMKNAVQPQRDADNFIPQ